MIRHSMGRVSELQVVVRRLRDVEAVCWELGGDGLTVRTRVQRLCALLEVYQRCPELAAREGDGPPLVAELRALLGGSRALPLRLRSDALRFLGDTPMTAAA